MCSVRCSVKKPWQQRSEKGKLITREVQPFETTWTWNNMSIQFSKALKTTSAPASHLTTNHPGLNHRCYPTLLAGKGVCGLRARLDSVTNSGRCMYSEVLSVEDDFTGICSTGTEYELRGQGVTEDCHCLDETSHEDFFFFSSGTLKDCFWFTSWWILW